MMDKESIELKQLIDNGTEQPACELRPSLRELTLD